MKRYILPLVLIISLIFSSCSLPFDKQSALTDNLIEVSDETTQFHFIDVGQGDCILIENGGTHILIDAGTTESGSDICAYLESRGIDYLDCFIGTHPHEDHLGGAASVLSMFKVGKVYLNGDMSNSYFYERFVDTLLEKEITPVIPKLNTTYEYGEIKLEFLSPESDFGNTNDNSLVVLVTFKDVKALFTGDAERAVEAELVASHSPIDADILKVGHHGSRNATSSEFLKAVSPSIAVIQCGRDNSYGHPHKEATDRLYNAGVPILRTDEKGAVVLRTDGTLIFDASGEVIEKNIENESIEVSYIGNIKSRIYHSDACRNLPKEENRIIFSSQDAAVKEGYTPCGNCMP